MTFRKYRITRSALIFLALQGLLPAAPLRSSPQASGVTANPVPSAQQLQSLVTRAMDNQHRNDRALEEFERVEHEISHKAGENSVVLSDRIDRVIPSGTGTMRLLLADHSSPVPPEAMRRQLQGAVDALDLALHPNERYKQDLAKLERRRRERAELVDAAAKAFRFTWAGRETLGSRTLEKIILDPDPNYKSTSRATSMFEHIHAVVWMDPAEAQLVRIEANITSDIGFGGGIAGKVYRGSHFIMEQSQVATGVWLPTQYIYEVDGRKFLFSFGFHVRTQISQYRRLGPPAEAIQVLRNELSKLTAEAPPQR